MDVKERLGRLDSILSGKRQTREEVISDLRKRIERLVDPRGMKKDRVTASPLVEWIQGEEVNTPYGEVFVSQEIYGSGYRHGGMLLDRVMEIPTDPVSLISKDESLAGLDFYDTLFIDLETTGLAGGTGTYAFLVGVGYFEGSRFVTRQFFLRDFSEERAMLWELRDLASRFRFLVTFNGKRFDIPLLETRFILCRMEDPFKNLPNYDLLYPSRRIWKGAYEDCRLTTLESCVLDIHRQDDVPSEMVPYLYFDYLRSRNGSRVHRIFYHNRMDILSLVTLVARIHEIAHAPQTASKSGWITAYALGRMFAQQRRMGEAIGCFEEALRVCKDPTEWEILKSLSMALKRERRLEHAVSIWMDMISLDGGRELFPYEEVAKFYEHQRKDYREALKWVEVGSERVRGLSPIQERDLGHRHQRLWSKLKRTEES